MNALRKPDEVRPRQMIRLVPRETQRVNLRKSTYAHYPGHNL